MYRHLRLHLSPNRKGRWHHNQFRPFLFSLFSTALWDLANSRPVQFLSSHLLFCLPCLLPPFTVPCKMVLTIPDEQETCPYHFSLRLFTKVSRFSCGPYVTHCVQSNFVDSYLSWYFERVVCESLWWFCGTYCMQLWNILLDHNKYIVFGWQSVLNTLHDRALENSTHSGCQRQRFCCCLCHRDRPTRPPNGELRTQKWKFKAWSRSVYCRAWYVYCQGFLPC